MQPDDRVFIFQVSDLLARVCDTGSFLNKPLRAYSLTNPVLAQVTNLYRGDVFSEPLLDLRSVHSFCTSFIPGVDLL